MESTTKVDEKFDNTNHGDFSDKSENFVFLIGFMGTGKSAVARYLNRAYNLKILDADQEIEREAGKSIPEMFEIHGESFFRERETLFLRQLNQKRLVVNQTKILEKEIDPINQDKTIASEYVPLEDVKNSINKLCGHDECEKQKVINNFEMNYSGNDTSNVTIISCGGGMPMKRSNVSLMKECGEVILLTASPETIYNRVKRSKNRPMLKDNLNLTFIENLLESRLPTYEQAADVVFNTDAKKINQIGDDLISYLRKEGIIHV